MLSRTKGREALLKVFYQYLFYLPASEVRPSLKEIFYSVFNSEEDPYYRSLFTKAINSASDVSIRSAPLLNDWTFSRLGLADQALIILADTEYRHFEVPKAVVINVYVDLAKAYCAEEDSYKFINGLLEKLL